MENTIRWRYRKDNEGNEVKESNARIVRWSDGSTSLLLGEVFDVHKNKIDGNFNHLFVQQVQVALFMSLRISFPALSVGLTFIRNAKIGQNL